uniref:ATP synthase complex subunit 8 n=1 Tax=Catacanthus incarnatus TaxID=696896 RepID=A0A4D6X449_CATIN|nr:ATP synthase F0 subunit 8 [Catacanthus incarnatus]QCI09290.1 ATP synthase F0 subunit 8 [Catacanthus incarnatus]
MPQMAPLWWEILFLMFIFSYLTMNILIYFNNKKENINQTNKNMNNMKNNKIMNWKW